MVRKFFFRLLEGVFFFTACFSCSFLIMAVFTSIPSHNLDPVVTSVALSAAFVSNMLAVVVLYWRWAHNRSHSYRIEHLRSSDLTIIAAYANMIITGVVGIPIAVTMFHSTHSLMLLTPFIGMLLVSAGPDDLLKSE